MNEIHHDLESHLRRSLGEPALAVSSLEPFGNGHSGFTYIAAIDPPGGLWVLRTSPPGVRIAGPTDVGRQGRIMRALSSAGRPAPAVLACSSEPAIGGRSFALTEFVEGTTWEPVADSYSARHVAEHVVEALVSLRSLSASEAGIGDEAPASLADELNRWDALLERAPEILHEPGRQLVRRLRARIPPPAVPSLVHGDFHYGNILFANGEVAAIIDWEIATLGDSRLDLGCLGVASLRRKYAPEPNPAGSVAVTYQELVSFYGGDEGGMEWFLAEACLKYGAILGYNLNLHRSGRRPDAVYEELLGTMRGLLDDGNDALDGRLDFA